MNRQDLRDALRLSKLVEGHPVEERQGLSLTEDDLAAIADTVVKKVREVLLIEMGKLVWDGIRKVFIGGAIGLMALNQLQGWLK